MIKVKEKVNFKNPIFVACWPGMGEVAFKAGLFLRDVLNFKEFAFLEGKNFYYPQSVIVKDGLIELPPEPVGVFYYYIKENKEIILFLAEAQPPFEKAYLYALNIIEFVKKLGCKKVFTFAAMPQPIEHTQTPSCWVSATSTELLEELATKFEVKILKEGSISGLNGLILGVAKEKGLKGICLLGEIPFYMIQIENPKASKRVLEIFLDLIGLNVDLSPLEERAKLINEEIDKIIGMIKGESPLQKPLDEKEIERIKKELNASTKLPESARKRIEELFKEAEHNISKAFELKKELDKWNVYSEYEDRFLDLFRKKKDH